MDNEIIQEKSQMYGSIHTHLESDKDAVNAHFDENGKISFKSVLDEFSKLGAKKIAITEHGAFSSFEDLYNLSKKYEDLDIIPGCEVYLTYDNQIKMDIENEDENKENKEEYSHLILIAKDNEGYHSLCKIISESNKNIIVGKTKSYPIVTYENLQKNVAEGHIIATSACIAGPLNKALLGNYEFAKEKLEESKAKLDEINYFNIKDNIEDSIKEYELETERINKIAPTKEEEELEKALIPEVADLMVEQLATKFELDEKSSKSLSRKFGTELRKVSKGLISNRKLEKKTLLHSPEYLDLKERATKSLSYYNISKSGKTINNYNEKEKYFNKVKEYYNDKKHIQEAREIYKKLYNIFGKDFYFELQNHHLPKEKKIYNMLIKFAISMGNPQFIASNDIHIGMHKSNPNFNAEVERRKVAKFQALKSYKEDSIDEYEYGIKTDNELRQELLDIVEPYREYSAEQIVDIAISNIEGALSQCKAYEPIKEDHYPKFADNDNELFEQLIQIGLKEKFPNGFPQGKEQEYEERLKKEINIIESMGYASYHLIVEEYLRYGRLLGYLPEKEIENAPLDIDELENLIKEKNYKRRGYSIGPGRGSAAGSLACYLLGITDIDPIKYNLLFERFLNPERKSMPDIDSDFNPSIREKAVEHCANKYGEENICRIMTKMYQASKGTIRLAGRYLASKDFYEYKKDSTKYDKDTLKNLGINEDSTLDEIKKCFEKKWYNVSDSLCKFLDNKEEGTSTIISNEEEQFIDDGELEEEEIINDGSIESLLQHSEFSKDAKECLRVAKNSNGMYSGDGEHACGVIISKHKISDVIPIKYNDKKDNFSTQCTMAQAEAKGLLKMDFLGLKQLAIITNVLKETDDDRLQNYSIREEILNDPNIFKHIYSSGKTLGIFQFESPGMTKLLKELQPDCFEDIIAAISLYRPGPMDFIPAFIEGKKNPDKVNYKCDKLKEILSPTYGVIVYQEQVMQIFQGVGYTMGGADAIRKAMGKKHIEEIEAERNNFIFGNEERHIDGAIKTYGMSENEANEFFDSMVKFGRYAFNKSHATAYAVVSLFTAYLKEYHPAEFYKETLIHLSTDKRNKKMSDYIKEMKEFDIEIEPPSLINSDMHYKVADRHHIYYGLSDAKGMSEFDIKTRSECLEVFITENPHLSETVLLNLANFGCFKTLWKEDTTLCSREDAKTAITMIKPKVDNLIAIKNNINELVKQFNETTDITLKKEIKSNYDSKKENLNTIKEEIKTIQEMCKTNKKEDKLLDIYAYEKNTMYSVLSAKKEKDLLQSSKIDFSALDKTDGAIYIEALVVGISDIKKTKSSGNTYYNVDLMDKNGTIITRRFKEIPPALIGKFKIPKEPYFNCNFISAINSTKPNNRLFSLKNTVNALLNNEINLNDIVGSKTTLINGYQNTLMEINPNTSKEVEEVIEGEDDICEER